VAETAKVPEALGRLIVRLDDKVSKYRMNI
jgi:hypothetical protein